MTQGDVGSGNYGTATNSPGPAPRTGGQAFRQNKAAPLLSPGQQRIAAMNQS